MPRFRPMRAKSPSIRRVLTVAVLAGTAYLLETELDRRVAPNDYDDLILWGGFVARGRRRQRLLGAGVHYGLSVALVALYARLAPHLPGRPGWRRGVVFVQVENALLYPGVPVLNAVHPEVRAGRLPSLLTWRYFWVEAARHLAFGATMGALLHEEKP